MTVTAKMKFLTQHYVWLAWCCALRKLKVSMISVWPIATLYVWPIWYTMWPFSFVADIDVTQYCTRPYVTRKFLSISDARISITRALTV